MTNTAWQQRSPVRVPAMRYLAEGEPAYSVAPSDEEFDMNQGPDAPVDQADAIGMGQMQMPSFGPSAVPTSGPVSDADVLPEGEYGEVPLYGGPTSDSGPSAYGEVPLYGEPEAQSAYAPEPTSRRPSLDLAGDLAAIKEKYAQAPVRKTPNWLERVAAAGLAGAAGYSNAARRAAPIDVNKVGEAVLYPGYDQKMAQFQSEVAPLEARAKITGEQIGAGYAAQKSATEANRLNQQANYYAGLGRGALVEVTPELAALSKGIYKTGSRIPAAAAQSVFTQATRDAMQQEKTTVVNDPDLAKTLGVALGTPVRDSIYQAGVTARARSNAPRSNRQPSIALLAIRAANGRTGDDQVDMLTPADAKRAIEIAKDRAPKDPMVDWLREQRMDAALRAESDKINQEKDKQQTAILNRRAAEISKAFNGATESEIWNSEDAGAIAKLKALNRRFAPEIQGLNDSFTSAFRNKGVPAPAFKVDPDTLNFVEVKPAAPPANPNRLPVNPNRTTTATPGGNPYR